MDFLLFYGIGREGHIHLFCPSFSFLPSFSSVYTVLYLRRRGAELSYDAHTALSRSERNVFFSLPNLSVHFLQTFTFLGPIFPGEKKFVMPHLVPVHTVTEQNHGTRPSFWTHISRNHSLGGGKEFFFSFFRYLALNNKKVFALAER